MEKKKRRRLGGVVFVVPRMPCIALDGSEAGVLEEQLHEPGIQESEVRGQRAGRLTHELVEVLAKR